jgi:zinc transport system substrate-binding protein
MSRFIAFLVLSCLTTLSWSQSMVVSTQPIYLIAKEIMAGVEEPVLLLANQSGHDISLTPQHRKIIQDANLVLWLGQAHEAPLHKMLAQETKAVSILNSGILSTLPMRSVRGKAISDTLDTHVWLDPNNAVRIGFFMAALRSQQFPEHKEQYWKNAKKFAHELLTVAQKSTASGAAKYYWSYHDAYQYLERPLNLKFAGAMTDDPHVAPTVAQIKYLNDSRPYQKMCLLAEGHASKNQYQKLNPIVFSQVDESMSGVGDFITGWKSVASDVSKCVLSIRK